MPDQHSSAAGGLPAASPATIAIAPPARRAGRIDEQRARGREDALVAASKFLGRLAQLELEALGEAIHRWHRVMAVTPEDWFAAEAHVAEAVAEARRHPEQELLLTHVADVFRRAPWFKPALPGARIGATEASAQYVATVAMLALLVRDLLRPGELTLLYTPLSRSIPLAALERE